MLQADDLEGQNVAMISAGLRVNTTACRGSAADLVSQKVAFAEEREVLYRWHPWAGCVVQCIKRSRR